MFEKQMTEDEIRERVEYLQSRIEWALDSNLPELRKEYEKLTSEIKNLYEEVSELEPTETLNHREVEQILEPLSPLVETPESKLWFYLLLYGIARVGYFKRDILLMVGLYEIMTKQALLLIGQFDYFFTWAIRDIYSSDIFGTRVSLPGETIDDILRYRIKNVHYSTRIWNNAKVLNDKLFDVLQLGLHTDISVDQMSKIISNHTGVAYSASVRLIRTEMNAVYNNTLLSYYKDSGIKQVQQISTLDMRTSEICRERHLDIVNIENAVIGENIPPLHPYCRSIIVPIVTLADGR